MRLSTVERIRVDARFRAAIFSLPLALIALYLLARANFLFFYSAVVGFSIIVASTVFVFTTRTHKYSRNNLLLFLGIAFFFIAFLSALRLMTYRGMGIFPACGGDSSARLETVERILEASAFLTAPCFIRRSFNYSRVFLLTAAFVGAAILAVFGLHPSFAGSGGNPTPVVTGRFVAILACTGAMIRFYLCRQRLSKTFYRFTMSSLFLAVLSESCLLIHQDSRDVANFCGLLFLGLSRFQLYKGIVILGLDCPCQTIFAELRKSAVTDPLTGLYNRLGFIELARDKLARAVRERRPLGALYLDVDNFKKVNDRYGHSTGDEVLKNIARIIDASVREQDVACRLGGDEFAILVDADTRHLASVAQRIHLSLQRWFRSHPVARELGISLGSAVWRPGEPESVELLLNKADEAMYKEKKGKKSRLRIGNP